MSSRQQSQTARRVYSYVFVGALVVAAMGMIAAALGASEEDRGSYTGMAILCSVGALAAVALLIAIERRYRRD